ncbi:DUF2249 domain-containing protein [Streptomyces sp. NPDC020917]|uniref:DUF2249 domain-containing protein n=1 Tax=Streptomyces sp. NPDC020917 TaxID=3365102 RepID=UPI0037B3FD93
MPCCAWSPSCAWTPTPARRPGRRCTPSAPARSAALEPGEHFTLVNNHDPKPLRREFEAAHPGAFTWEYLESGPEHWRIRIGRPAGAS